MINDTRITYLHDGTPRSVTVDGIEYPIEKLRRLLRFGHDLGWFVALALLYGVVIGGAIALVFVC